MSEPMIHIAMADKREGLPEYDQTIRCPKCDVPCEDGFGMAGGGFGVYTVCPQCCQITSKSVFADDE